MKRHFFLLFPLVAATFINGCTKDDDNNGLSTVTTAAVTEVGSASAKTGGNVTDKGGSNVIDRGICWSTSPNPTTDDIKENYAWGTGEFESVIINLTKNTTYYVRAYAINEAGTAYGNQQTFTTLVGVTPVVNGGGVIDIDGNYYPSVIIAGKEWMSENLRTSRFANGDVMTHIAPQDEWTNTPTGTAAYCWFRNEQGNDMVFGKLYNGYVVMDQRNCCPSGWHVPTGDEWEGLQTHLRLNGYNYDGSNIADVQGKSVASTTGWFVAHYPNGPGDNPETNNSSGFNGRPAGDRHLNAFGSGYQFAGEGELAQWWGRPWEQEQTPSTAGIGYNGPQFSVGNTSDLRAGFSIRCVRD